MSDPNRDLTECWPLSEPPSLGSPLPRSMHALTIHRDRYGAPSEVLRVEQVPLPRLQSTDAGKVLVAILATGPNFNTNFASLGLPVPVFGRGDTATILPASIQDWMVCALRATRSASCVNFRNSPVVSPTATSTSPAAAPRERK